MNKLLFLLSAILFISCNNTNNNQAETVDSVAIQQEQRQNRIDFGKQLIDESLAYKDSSLSKHYSMEAGDKKAKPVLQSYDSLKQLMPPQDTLVLNKYQLQQSIKLLAKHNQ